VILYAARLEEQKRPDVFLQALRKLREKGQFHALVGEDPVGQLKSQLEPFGLQGSVQFLGSLPTERMPSLIAASDIFFLPSQNEGISQAVYEAMACGVVVVSADVGGQAEVVTPECGVLVSPQESADVAGRYADVLHDLAGDANRRLEMSQASRQRMVERFSIQQMGDCLHTNLNRVIEDKKNKPGEPAIAYDQNSLERETRTLVEYLQLKTRLRQIEPEYSELVKPRPPSYWFYLWIRQLFLPVYQRMQGTRSLRWITSLQLAIKSRLVKTP
jgi:hypothetical protein